MRYLGLDVGAKAIGVAAGELLASELTTIAAHKDENFYDQPDFAYQELARLLVSEEAQAIVAGLPVNEDGAPTEESQKIEKFCQGLQKTLNVPLHFVDETLTSYMAADMLESQGADKREADRRVHQLAAELILQQYLEENESH